MGVGLTPCSLQQTGEPSFEIGENEMEIGLGHHGEPGIRKVPLESADHVADQLLEPIFNDMPLNGGEEVTVLVNGLGSTSRIDRKSTRLNSSHVAISYAVFCLKKKM